MTGKVSWTPETQSLWSGLTREDSTTHLTNLPHTLPQIRDPWCPAEEAVQEESLGFRTRHQVGILRAAGDPPCLFLTQMPTTIGRSNSNNLRKDCGPRALMLMQKTDSTGEGEGGQVGMRQVQPKGRHCQPCTCSNQPQGAVPGCSPSSELLC